MCAVRAALPIPIGVCSIFLCPDSGMAASVGISNVRTATDTVYRKSVYWTLTLGEKSLAAPGTRTRVSIAPGFQSDALPTELSPAL